MRNGKTHLAFATLSDRDQRFTAGIRRVGSLAVPARSQLRWQGTRSSRRGQQGPDGGIHSIQVDLGRWLGLGSKLVTIGTDKFEHLADQVRLRLRDEEVQSLPDATQ